MIKFDSTKIKYVLNDSLRVNEKINEKDKNKLETFPI
jgi:hypothetical protein